MKFKKIKLGKYFFDFVAVFFAVISAFALNNWNDNRRDAEAEEKILLEIKNGLIADLKDIADNKKAHNYGVRSCNFFSRVFNGEEVPQDSIQFNYMYLTVGNSSVMNTSGYESLKSKGLEIIKNDSVRVKIIELYEVTYEKIGKLEEENPTLQIFNNFYLPINRVLSPYMNFVMENKQIEFSENVTLNHAEKKLMESYLWRMQLVRKSMLGHYARAEEKIRALLTSLDSELEN